MLKRGLIGCILVCLLALTASPAAAVPVADLTALARHFPAQAHLFGSIRIDDGYIGFWDGLARRLAAAFPDDFPRTTLTEELDRLSKPFGGDFRTVFRPWLGDTAAFAVIDYGQLLGFSSGNPFDSFILAFAITDPAGAEAYIDALNARDSVSAVKTRSENGILYEFARGEIRSLLIRDDVILIGNLAEVDNRVERLSDFSGFTDALARLPESDYNALFYISYPDVIEEIQSSMTGMGFDDLLAMSLQVTRPAAVGFTVLDDRSFVADFAIAYDEAAIAEFYNLDPALFEQRPFDPAFARFIPSGTPLVLFDNDLASGYQGVLAQLFAMATSGGSMPNDEVERALDQINFAFRGATGLTLDELFGWMSGDYALWVGLSDAAQSADSISGLIAANPVEFGLLIDASVDPDAAAAAVRGVRQGFSTLARWMSNGLTRLSVTDETIGGVEVAVLTITDRDLPFPIEIIVGANAEVFVLGTRGAVEAAFNPSAGLDIDPAFQEALAFSLPGLQSLGYASGLGLLPLIDNALESQLGDDAVAVRTLLSLLSSSSIGLVYTTDYGLMRMVITLPE